MKHSKFTLTAVTLLVAAIAQATIIISEDFGSGYDLTSGTGVTTASLAGQNPSNSPFSAAWTESGTTLSTVQRSVSWDATGRAILEDTSNGNTDFYADRTFSGGLAPSTSYFAFDLTTGSSVASGTYAAITCGAKGYFGSGVDINGNIAFFFGGAAVSSSSTAAVANTTYRLVLKMTEAGGNTDQWSLFINPTSAVEGEQTAAKSGIGSYYVGGNASFPLSNLRIGKDDVTETPGGTTYFDNIILGTTFADVAVVPEPSTYALLLGFFALGGVMLRRRLRS